MKLEIELVPSTIWFSNIRNAVSKDDWDKIREESYAKTNYKCGICGVTGKLNCHEIWEYDDKNKIQRLNGFIALCDNCHWIKHIGLAGIMSNKGKLNYEELIEHFCKVNECTRESFLKYEEEAFKKWEERSKHQWKQDFGIYSKSIKPSNNHKIR